MTGHDAAHETAALVARRRTRYRFVTRIESHIVEGGIYVWESVEPILGDSRHDQIRCPASWFFEPAKARQIAPESGGDRA